MDTDRFLRISDIFHEVQGQPREERERCLNEACPDDPALRREVEKLLAEHAEPSLPDLEQQSVLDAGSFSAGSEHAIGQELGQYRIIRCLGEGGMGRVYLAERIADFDQQVAIKIARPGQHDEITAARFRDEMKFLAALSQHAQIAGILDAGTTKDGRPYLVMDYVDGLHIDAYCNERSLSVEERLRLLQSVCRAVEFAHQHALIHRDLKPSNILVTADGTAMLIDFGIAKLLSPSEVNGASANENSIKTQTIYRALTPHYASPEQIRGDLSTIRSDVYSLGVVLYELITGQRPFDLTTTSVAEMERIVCEQDPAPPSTRIRKLTPDTFRDLETDDQWRRRVSGDLDNIVMKCLRKEPGQRYESVRDLSDDLDRHLSGLPVSARQISPFDRGWRWCKRNPLVTALSLALSLSLVAGLFGVGLQWRRAEHNAARAQAEAARANKAAQLAEEAAVREKRAADAERVERLKAEQAENVAAAAAADAKLQAESAEQVTEFLIGVFQGADQLGVRGYRFGPPPDGSTNPTARELLGRGLQMIETELKDEPQIRARIKTALSETYISLGDLAEAEKLAQAAMKTQRALYGTTANPKTADALSVLAMIRYIQGDYEAAVPLYRESVGMLDGLYGEMDPRGASYKLFFAFVVLESNLTGQGNHEAEQLINQVLEIRQEQTDPPPQELAHAWLGKAIMCRVRKEPLKSLQAINQAREVLREDPNGATYIEMAMKSVNAMVNWQLGRTEVAHRQSSEVIDSSKNLLGRYHPLATHLQLEMATWMFGADPERGLELMKEAVAACHVAYGRQPRTARALYRYAGQLLKSGELNLAEASLRESVGIYLETLGQRNVRTHRALRLHAKALDTLDRTEEATVQRGLIQIPNGQE